MSNPKPMRGQMVQTSAFIDSLREVFGKDSINMQIRRGMQGEPVFYASEAGQEIGTKIGCRSLIAWDERGIAYDKTAKGGAV